MANFNNIIGPPCSSVIDTVKNDPELIQKEIIRQNNIQKDLTILGPPPEEWQFIRPGSGSKEVLGELTGSRLVGNCFVSYYQLPQRLDGRLGYRLWSFHQARNRYAIEAATISCVTYPPQQKKATQVFEFVATIYNKITTTTNYEFYIGPENNSAPPSGPVTNFINSGGKTKFFSCDIENDPWYSLQPTVNEEIKELNFNLSATVVYLIDHPTGSWNIIGSTRSGDDESKISITTDNYDANDNTTQQFKKQSSFTNFTNDYIDGVYVPPVVPFGNIPNEINSKLKKWVKYNTYKDPKQLSYDSKKYEKRTVTCEDDCGRPINIVIHKRFLTEKKIQTVSCPGCNPPYSPKYAIYITKHNGSLQPKITQCKLL